MDKARVHTYSQELDGAGTAAVDVRDAVATETEVEDSAALSVEASVDETGTEMGAAKAMIA